MLRKNLYTAEFPTDATKKNYIKIDELNVELPIMPPESEMRNYHLATKDQKFIHDKPPQEYRLWKFGSVEKNLFADQMFHLRDNGEWWLINGKPIYVPGSAWFFFNCWILQEGRLPKFRMEAVEFYQVEDWIWRSPFIMGMLLFKMRQEGASAKINCAIYNRTTRHPYSKAGIMGNDEQRAKANIAKIQIAHNKMIDIFQPIVKGSNKDVTGINFTLPHTIHTNKKLREGEEREYTGLESEIYTNASVLKAFDGDRLTQFYFDEFGKVWRFNVYEQLNKIKPMLLSQDGEGHFSGKAYYGSTVEDSQDIKPDNLAYLLDNLNSLYKDSNPNKLDSKGRTETGLVRYLRDSISATMIIDEFGFPNRARAEKEYDEMIAKFEKDKAWQKIAQYKKLYPRSISDALSGNSLSCILFPHLLDQKIHEIRSSEHPKAIRGNLVWVDSTWTSCKWIPDANGKWWISQHPHDPNARVMKGTKYYPKNHEMYKMGVDPTDTVAAVSHASQLSKTAIVVKRALDRDIEFKAEFYEVDGIKKCRNPQDLITNRYVCTYHNRNDDPLDNYIDTLKTAVYYGCKALIESNSPYTYVRMREDFPAYVAAKPDDSKSDVQLKRARRNPNQIEAQRTTVREKRTYNDILISYTSDYWSIIEHMNLLEDMRRFNGQNHTDCDLVVATALAELQDSESKLLNDKLIVKNEWKTNVFMGVPNYY